MERIEGLKWLGTAFILSGILMTNLNIYPLNISHINIGYGDEISISDLAYKIKDIVNYKGDIVFNSKMPDGTMNKLMDSSLINSLGWRAKINLENGLIDSYNWFLKNYESSKRYF